MLTLYKQESTLHDINILLISLIFRNYIISRWQAHTFNRFYNTNEKIFSEKLEII